MMGARMSDQVKFGPGLCKIATKFVLLGGYSLGVPQEHLYAPYLKVLPKITRTCLVESIVWKA
jgi:hypothetical protein